MKQWTALLLAFWSAAAVLILEILAGRLLAPYVGVSLETYTGVIGTVLAGIAIGSAVGGRAADRIDPRRLLGPTVFVGGIFALLSLPAVSVLGPRLLDTDRRVAIVLLAVSAFVLPTAVLSAVSPMIAKLRLASTAETGAVVGGVSAAGTAGALVGTFLTGFVLVAAWPSRPIIVGVGVALVLTGLLLTRRLRDPDGPAGEDGFTSVGGALLIAALATWLAATSGTPCDVETAYFCASVRVDPARPSGRVLMLDDLRHSYVDLDRPTHLEFRYEKLFALTVDELLPASDPDARNLDALHIGGGGFTFPRWMRATRPESSHRVLELDEQVVALGERRLGLVLGPRLRVVTGDARISMRDVPSDSFDLVVADAFGGRSVPWHLTTVEMLIEVKRALRSDGVYLLNVIDGGSARFVRAQLRTLLEVFDEVAVVVPPAGTYGNYVVVASDRVMQLADPPTALGRLIDGRRDVEAFIGDAVVLRDDYAPVDQLISERP